MVGLTLRDDLPEEHNDEDRPEETYTLGRHLVIVVQCLEQVGGRDCRTLSRTDGAKNAQIRTGGGPEALGRLHQHVLQQTGVPIAKQLRSNQREDGETRVLMDMYREL